MADAEADGTRRNDPCWESARTMLKPGGLQAIEDEAREWRRTLTESLEQYHNEQQRAYYALHPGASYAVYRRWRADFHPRPPNTNNNTRDLDVMSTNSQEAYTRRRFDFFLPRRVAERTRGLCRRPLLLGGRSSFRTSVDGFVACGMDAMVADGQLRSGDDGSCIVYSLGSNNIFEFEEAVLRKTNCSVHTFDCTSSPPTRSLGPRFTFHPICVGHSKAGMEHPEAFKTLVAIMRDLGHAALAIVKWDVEGFEYDLFREMLAGTQDPSARHAARGPPPAHAQLPPLQPSRPLQLAHAQLPRELLFELHYRSHMRARTGWWDREKTAGELADDAAQEAEDEEREARMTAKRDRASRRGTKPRRGLNRHRRDVEGRDGSIKKILRPAQTS